MKTETMTMWISFSFNRKRKIALIYNKFCSLLYNFAKDIIGKDDIFLYKLSLFNTHIIPGRCDIHPLTVFYFHQNGLRMAVYLLCMHNIHPQKRQHHYEVLK